MTVHYIYLADFPEGVSIISPSSSQYTMSTKQEDIFSAEGENKPIDMPQYIVNNYSYVRRYHTHLIAYLTNYLQFTEQKIRNVLYIYISETAGGDGRFKNEHFALVEQLIEIFIALRTSSEQVLSLFAYDFLSTLPCNVAGMYQSRAAALRVIKLANEASHINCHWIRSIILFYRILRTKFWRSSVQRSSTVFYTTTRR